MEEPKSTDDFVIKVEKDCIPCNRDLLSKQSDYFRALLSSQMTECEDNSVLLKDVSYGTVLALVNCITTGHLALSDDTLLDVVQAAVRFQIPAAIESCESYMLTKLDDTNGFSFFQTAKSLCLEKLYSQAKRHILYYFTTLILGEEFLALGLSDTVEYLADKHLNCEKESNVLEAINNWVYHDYDSRIGHLGELLECFHGEDLLPSEWKHVESHLILKDTAAGKTWLEENAANKMSVIPRHKPRADSIHSESEDEENEQVDKEQTEEQQVVREQTDEQKMGREQTDNQQVVREQTDKQQVVREQTDEQQVGREQTDKQQVVREQTAKQQVGREQTDKQQVVREKTDKQQVVREQTDKQQVGREQTDKQQVVREQTGEQQVVRKQTDEQQVVKEQTGEQQVVKEQTDEQQVVKEQTDEQQVVKEQTDEQQVVKEQMDEQQVVREQTGEQQVVKEQTDKQKMDNEQTDKQQVVREKKNKYRELPLTFMTVAGRRDGMWTKLYTDICTFDPENQEFYRDCTFEEIHDMDEMYFRIVALGKDLYITGGQRDRSYKHNRVVWKYDGFKGFWDDVTKLPSPRHSHAACAYKSSLYVISGFGKRRELLDSIQEYNTVKDEWHDLPNVPAPCPYSVAVCCSDKLFVYTGLSLYSYDFKTANWTTLLEPCKGDETKSMFSLQFSACVFDKFIYYFPLRDAETSMEIELVDDVPLFDFEFGRVDTETCEREVFESSSEALRFGKNVVSVRDRFYMFDYESKDLVSWSVYKDDNVTRIGSGRDVGESALLAAIVEYPTYRLGNKK